MSRAARANYSIPQRILHWIMAAFILFNLLFPGGMEQWNRTVRRGGEATADQIASANIHAYIGIAVLALGVLRLILRFVQGAPAAPAAEPALPRLASKIAHGAFYLLFFLMPMSGIGAYYFGNGAAGNLHGGLFKLLMWVLIAAHILGVLVHQLYWKTDVLKRMTSGTAKAA